MAGKGPAAPAEAVGQPAAPYVVLPFRPLKAPMCRDAVKKKFPGVDDRLIDPLAFIWDEVVHRIVGEMLVLTEGNRVTLHVDIRADMTLELAQLQLWLADLVVKERTKDRDLASIDTAEEREACLGEDGSAKIMGTAQLAYKHIWKRKMDERWVPKSLRAIERQANPKKPKLAIKPVGKNHFIPLWFIRDHWAVDGKVQRWRQSDGAWTSARRGFGKWGYRHNLYSDRLEAYFSLLEGDAKQPVEMLLDMRPLNDPQCEALVGFLIIQILRNPTYIENIHRHIAPAIAEAGHADDPEMPRKAYETLFSNNDLYRKMASPVMASRWAIVKTLSPMFILPDTFGLRGAGDSGLRMIVPLSPTACFVTLPGEEVSKRVVPYHLRAEDELARRMSAALINASQKEFLSHPDFALPEVAAPTIGELLAEIEEAIALQNDDEP